MTLELAKEEDFARVNELARQVHDLHVAWRPDIYRETDTPISPELYRELLNRSELYVLRKEGKILAMAVISTFQTEGPGLIPRTVLRLEQLCVDGACRRQGVGRCVMEQLEQLGRRRGCTDLQLTCDPKNQIGRAFYESLGMEGKVIQYRKKL